MRLIVSASVLAIWMAETPSGVADAFSIQVKPRISSTPRYSGLSAPSSLHMSTMERPMTAPNSPNSNGHGYPFGSYGKPPQDGSRDDSAYSFGPKTPRDSPVNSNSNDAPADSFEAYMRGRNRDAGPPSNPSSPSDNYVSRQQSAPTSNFGGPTQTMPATNANNNFGAPPSPPTPTGNNDSFSAYATRGNASSPPPPVTNFGAPSTPQTPQAATNNFGAPSTPQTPQAATNNFGAPSTPQTPQAATNNFGAPSTPQTSSTATNNFGAPSAPQTPPAAPTAGNNNNSFSSFATGGSNSTPAPTSNTNNFGAPTSQQTSGTSSSRGSNNLNSFESFATGGNASEPQSQAPPAPGSFEAYMNSRRNDNTNSSSQPASTALSNDSAASPFPSPADNSQSRIASTVAAAADPNSPLPPYMSPASLEDPNIKSANLPDSPSTGIDRPGFQPPMPGMATQESTSTVPVHTTFREQDNSMRNQIAPPIKAPLARAGTPLGQLDIGAPSQELVGRLDQVLNKQREFEVRLDNVDQKIDRTTQENIERTQSMLNEFREDNMRTQETFMNRVKDEVGGMKSTMDRVLSEQRELKQKQENQTVNFANLEKARSDQAEKLMTLEKTTSIRAQNIERNTSQEAVNQSQRLEALERNAAAGSQQGDGSNNFLFEQQQNERMTAFEQSQLERMAAFEESQRQELENALREHRVSSQQHQNMNDPNDSDYRQEQERMDETELRLQERLEEAQKRKEELLQQLRDMQQQEELYMNTGDRSSAPPPPPPYANPLGQQQNFQQQESQPGSPSQYNTDSSRFDRERDGFDQSKQSRFEDEEEEEMQPRRNMLRDRLGKASGEKLYQPSGDGRRGVTSVENFDDENDYDDGMNQRMMGMDPEEKRRVQHERMMRRDPVSPPVAMESKSQRRQNSQPLGSPAGRYDPRRGGPSDDMLEDEIAYGISEESGMRKTLNNMRSFKGDEPLPNTSLFDQSGAMGGAKGMDRRGSSQQNGRRSPAATQTGRGMREKHHPPQHRSGPKQHHANLSDSPPPNPLVDKKIEHFLKETLKSGPKPHFDKEMESLLMVKYSPLFSWLKPANVSFLRNVLVTYLQHKGCQVEMDLNSASPKAAQEWNELLNILSFELKQRTGEDPRIMEEPNNQWGIYGSKNVRLKISADNTHADRQKSRGGGVTPEEAARRKRRNDRAFIVSTDPTDPNTRLL